MRFIFGSALSFAAPIREFTGMNLNYATLGDLNGDGKPDLATANGDDQTVSVLLNRGAGRFAEARKYTTDLSPEWVAIADLNGGGQADLVSANGDG
jgi:FG-GAP-like repeat